MPIISRFSRLFTADLNAVLDRIEEPDVILRQAVRDMENELLALNEQARVSKQNAEHAAAQEHAADEQLRTLDEELDVCFAADEEQLARSLVKRKLETDKRRKDAHDRHNDAQRYLVQLEQTIAQAGEKLATMREKVAVVIDSPCTVRSAPLEVNVGADEIDIAFLREKQRRGQA